MTVTDPDQMWRTAQQLVRYAQADDWERATEVADNAVTTVAEAHMFLSCLALMVARSKGPLPPNGMFAPSPASVAAGEGSPELAAARLAAAIGNDDTDMSRTLCHMVIDAGSDYFTDVASSLVSMILGNMK